MAVIDSTFFTQNRERTYSALKGGFLAVAGYAQMQRSNDMAFQFEQEASFWYLTGIDYPDWQVLLDGKRRRAWLIAPDVEEHQTLFDGSLSHEEARRISGIEDIITQREADSWLRQASRSHPLAYVVDAPQYATHFGFTLNPAVRELRDQLTRIFTKVDDFRPELAKIRAIKQPLEIEAMQAAINVTVAAFNDVKANLANYKNEYEVEADFTAYFRRRGAAGHAYDPIVAAGANACTLHYVRNAAKLKKGQLLLLDIGARHHGYAADITRTYAIGAATKRQQEVHGAVEQAQKEIISMLQPGLALDEFQQRVDATMQRALIELKLIDNVNDPKYRTYFPHAISHGLGIDVHDALGRPTVLEPGMVLTVEPGIYIPEQSIGVRIEDDILITDNGHKNMSAKLSTSL